MVVLVVMLMTSLIPLVSARANSGWSRIASQIRSNAG